MIDSAYTCIIVFIRNSCAYLLFRIWMICRCRFTNWCYLSALAQSVALRPACVCVELVTCIATVFYRQFLHPGRFYKTQLIKVHDLLRSSIRDFQFMPPNVLVRSSKRICVVSLFVLRLFLLKPLWLIWIFGMLLQLVVFQHLVCDLYCGWCKQVRSFLKLKAEWLIGDLMVDLEASKI